MHDSMIPVYGLGQLAQVWHLTGAVCIYDTFACTRTRSKQPPGQSRATLGAVHLASSDFWSVEALEKLSGCIYVRLQRVLNTRTLHYRHYFSLPHVPSLLNLVSCSTIGNKYLFTEDPKVKILKPGSILKTSSQKVNLKEI